MNVQGLRGIPVTCKTLFNTLYPNYTATFTSGLIFKLELYFVICILSNTGDVC